MTDTLDRPSAPPPPDPTAGGILGAGPSEPQAPADSGNWVRLALLIGALGALALLFGWSLLAVVGVLVFSIFLHEMGHYLVARATGMKVSEFFISFGPRIWSFRRGETEYGIKAVPVGAYVRIVGMSNLEDIDPADEARTYRAQSYPKRLAVVLAGPFTNIMLGVVLMAIVFMGSGVAGTTWTVNTVVPDSAASAAGIEQGDQIVSVAGAPVASWDDFGDAVTTRLGQQVDVVVVRDGNEITLPVRTGWRLADAAAGAVAPLVAGDVVQSLNGESVTTYESFAEQVATLPPGTAEVYFMRGGETYHTEIDVPARLPADGATGFFGVGPQFDLEKLSPLAATGRSFTSLGSLVANVGSGLVNFFWPDGLSNYADLVTSSSEPTTNVTVASDKVIVPVEKDAPAAVDPANDPAEQARPVSILGIGRLLGQAAGAGWASFFLLLAGFNLMVGLFNLLPLPPLDGGHALVATYEAVRGKIAGRAYRVNMARLLPITYAVVFVLAGLGLTSIWLDAVKPLDNPYGP